MTDIILCGCSGNMGKVISKIAKDFDVNIVCGIDIITENGFDYPIYDSYDKVKENPCCVVDFSHPKVFDKTISYCEKNLIPCVLCTTGLSKEQIQKAYDLSKKVPVFYSANMSLGVNLIIELAKKATEILEDSFDIEILEKHHNQKLDSPSGTALMIADAIKETRKEETEYVYTRHDVRKKREKKEIGISAIRGGTIVGEHEIIFAGKDEIITISHSARSKEIFAVGALKAASFLKDKKPALYNMSNLIKN